MSTNPLEPVGFNRVFEVLVPSSGAKQYQEESIGWSASPDRCAHPVEIVIAPEWNEVSPINQTWRPGFMRYRVRAEAGQSFDFAGAVQLVDGSNEHGFEMPLSSVPANGVRYRLDARSVTVDVRVGYPTELAHPVRVRVAIVPLRAPGPMCIVPSIDSWDYRGDDMSHSLRFPVGAREWRVIQSGLPVEISPGVFEAVPVDPDEIDVIARAPFDGATVGSYTAGELADWTPIPFEGYQWSVTGSYFVTAIYR